jgi:restriction endonuclease S subunit
MLDLPINEQKAAVKELDDEIGRFESKKAKIEALRERMESRIIAGLS